MDKICFCSLIPSLLNKTGHQYIYHIILQEVATKLGLSFQAYLPHACNISKLPLKWKKIFRKKDNARFSFLETFFRCLDFSKIFRLKISSNRIFFLESFNTTDLMALFFSSLFFLNQKDSLWLLLRYSPNQLPLKGKLHALFMNFLTKKIQKRFVVLTDSPLLVPKFKVLKHINSVIPIPHTKIEQLNKKKKKRKKIYLWWPGSPRKEKGLLSIQNLLKTQDPRGKNYLFILSKETTLQPLEITLRYHLIPEELTREEYLHWMHSSDVILLPYDDQTYRFSTSGIFVEAVIAGKIPLVKEGSWLACELKKFELHSLIVDWNPFSFFTHLHELIENVPIREKLNRMQEVYKKYHSLENFQLHIRELIAANY